MLLIGLVVVAGARADEALQQALQTIPADALGVICIPNIEQGDQAFHQTLERLALTPMVPPPNHSVASMLQTYLGMSAGLNPRGALLIVMLPAPSIMELGDQMAMLVPVQDSKALLEAMKGTPGEGDVWTVTIMGEPVQALALKSHVAFGRTAELVQAFKKATADQNVDKKLNEQDRKSLDGLSAFVWLDAAGVIELARPQIDMFLPMITSMQAASGPFGAAQAKSTKETLDTLLEGSRSFMFGLKLNEAGLALRVHIQAKDGTKLAKQMEVQPAPGAQALLAGLPASDYMLAGGWYQNPEATKESFDSSLGAYFDAGKDMENVDAEQVKKLRESTQEFAQMATAARFTVDALAGGDGGLVGLTLLLETRDAEKCIRLLEGILAAAAKVSTDEEVLGYFTPLSFAPATEEVANTKVHELRYDVSKLAEVDPDDFEELKPVIGKDGLLFRLAAVGSKRVLVAFGGGTERMAKLIEAARTDEAPLAADAGIQRVHKHLPEKPVAEFYVAVDRIVQWYQKAAEAMDEEPLPIEAPTLHAPLAMATTSGKTWTQTDLFVPAELMVAIKDATMKMLGQGAAMEMEHDEEMEDEGGGEQ